MLKNIFLLLLLSLVITMTAVLLSGRLSYFLAHKMLDHRYGWCITAQKGRLDLIGGSLTMHHVWLRSPRGENSEIVIRVEHLRATADPFELLRGQRAIRQLTLDGMRLKHISSVPPSPGNGKTMGAAPDSTTGSGQNPFLVRQLVVKNGFIEFIHQKKSLRKTHITLDNVNITTSDVNIGKGLDAFLNSLIGDRRSGLRYDENRLKGSALPQLI